MFKKLLVVFLAIPVLSPAQSLNISIEKLNKDNQYNSFRLQGNDVSFAGGGIEFLNSGKQFADYLTYGISPDYGTIGILQNSLAGDVAYLLDTSGDTLISYNTVSISSDDPSLAVYPLRSGAFLIQNNITNFILYNADGSIISSSSGSSQSKEGETIAKVTMDAMGKTVLIYTPKIKRGNNLGSQAMILRNDNTMDHIFSSNDRAIKYVEVSSNGELVVLVTQKEGTDDQVVVLDRFGNKLNSISSGEDLIAAHLSGNAEDLIIYSSRRAIVYSTLSEKRVGSTSFRSPLILAQYFPDDHTIIGFSGTKVENTQIYKDVEFHAINLEKREIAQKEMSGALGTNSNIKLQFTSPSTGDYWLEGSNNIIRLKASF